MESSDMAPALGVVFFKSNVPQEHKLHYSKGKGHGYLNTCSVEQDLGSAFSEIISYLLKKSKEHRRF